MNIILKNADTTVGFAAQELKKYLALLDPGIPETFSVALGIENASEETDGFEISIGKNGGALYGTNPRSVLYAVYNYLEALGIRWCRHGADGEYIPSGVKVAETAVSKNHTYSHKHRGMCIEGALSYENVLDNIDWAAKSGLNSYLIQGIIPSYFFEAWYAHKLNPVAEKTPFTPDDAVKMVEKLVPEMKKRGIIFHDVGHGWTTLPFGYITNEAPVNPDESKFKYLAQVNGKRKYFLDRPLDTHLCYSNPEARRLMLDHCVDFVKKHPEIDVLHFWLADGDRNNCECENCIKKSPSDWLIVVLNELDSRLSEIGFNKKIVIPQYQSLLWTPKEEKLNNPQRFILQFCPIGRNYKNSYGDLGELPEVPEYVLNMPANPEQIEENVAHLHNWLKAFPGIEAISFEYYYWMGGGNHYDDFGGFNLAKIVYEDIRNIKQMGIQGILSCQTQRAFLSDGLGQYVYTRALADDSIPFDTMVDNYYADTFGEFAEVFKKHYGKLSEICSAENSADRCNKVKAEAESMLDAIASLPESKNHTVRKSVFYAEFQAKMLVKFMETELETFEKGIEGAKEKWREFITFVCEAEPSVQPVFDAYLFFYYLRGIRHTELKNYPDLWE